MRSAVKRVLRKLMRWYVEPAFAEQRIVNDALLRLVDELSRRVDELERRDEARRLHAAGAVRARRHRDLRGRTRAALREHGHETELVTVPYKWYPGERVLTQAFLWRLLDLDEANGRPIDAVIATKFPSYAVRHPRKVVWLLHQFRQAWDLDRTELGQFSESAEDRALRRKVLEFDRVALGEARQDLHDVVDRRGSAARLDRPRRRGARAAACAARRSTATAYEDFILSVNRLDRAKRIDLLIEAAAQASGLRIVIAGDGPDRERLEQLARERGLDGRATFTGRVSDEELADLYARCLGVYYAPVNEDYGLVPYEAFLSREAGRDDDRCGRTARHRPRPRDGARRCADASRSSRAHATWLRDNTDEARTLGRAGRDDRARGDVGLVHRAPARGGRMRVAYFSPLPPSTSGIADYSALLLPALEQLVEVEVVRPGRTRPVADADVALYHVGNDPDAHAWVVDALRRRPGVVVLHDFVIHHLVAGMTIGRNDGHAYLAAMEREAGVAGRMLGWGVLEGRVPPLWEIRPTEFPLAGEVLDRATGVIVHSRYVEARVREHGYDGPLWHIPHPAWAVDGVEPAPSRGRAALRLLRPPEREQAHAAGAAGVRRAARATHPGRAAPARRRRGARLRPRRASRAARPRQERRHP